MDQISMFFFFSLFPVFFRYPDAIRHAPSACFADGAAQKSPGAGRSAPRFEPEKP